jgi:hypothetical protein
MPDDPMRGVGVSDTAYQVLIYAARYWFAALAVFILARAVIASVREARIVRDIRRRIEEVAAFAELILIQDETGLLEPGARYAFARDAVLGSASGSDVRVRHRDVARKHLTLSAEADCVRVRPARGKTVRLDGEAVKKEGLIFDGGEIAIGGLRFRVKMSEYMGGAHA